MKDEPRSDAQDAARYRWLRDHFLKDVCHRLTWYLPMTTPLTAEGLDSNIDEQIERDASMKDERRSEP